MPVLRLQTERARFKDRACPNCFSALSPIALLPARRSFFLDALGVYSQVGIDGASRLNELPCLLSKTVRLRSASPTS
jgi:hypothetical protein